MTLELIDQFFLVSGPIRLATECCLPPVLSKNIRRSVAAAGSGYVPDAFPVDDGVQWHSLLISFLY